MSDPVDKLEECEWLIETLRAHVNDLRAENHRMREENERLVGENWRLRSLLREDGVATTITVAIEKGRELFRDLFDR